MNEGLVSVIMSAYNERPAWLRASIESILGQTYRDLELIVLLDAPENAVLEELILEYAAADERIVFAKNDRNRGLVYSLNRALSLARGAYIARMDADDISLPDRLETQLAALRAEDLDLVAANIVYMDEDGTPQGDPADPPVCQGKALGSWPALLRVRNFVAHPTWLARAEAFRAVGPYHEIPRAEDYEWLCRAALLGLRMRKLERPLLYYRKRQGSISTNGAYVQMLVAWAVQRQYRRALARGREFDEDALFREIGKIDLTQDSARYRRAVELYYEAWKKPPLGCALGVLRSFATDPVMLRRPFEMRRMRRLEKKFTGKEG